MNKHKLIRNINKGVAIIAAGTIMFTSCNNMDKDFSGDNTEILTSGSVQIEQLENNAFGILTNTQKENYLIKALDHLEVNYSYEKFYYDRWDYLDIYSIMKSQKKCYNEKQYNLQNIINILLNNSGLNNCVNEKEINLREAIILAMNNLFKDADYVGDDFCTLKNYKFALGDLEYTIAGNNSYAHKLITIDYDYIEECYEKERTKYKENTTFIEYLAAIVRHELNHSRQYICGCRYNSGQLNDSLKFNNGLFSSLIEASAESEIYNKKINGQDYNQKIYNRDYTYEEKRLYQSYLFLLGMFKKDFSIDKYYEAMFNNDLTALFDLYNLKSRREIIDFCNIMYAMDSLCSKTKLSAHIFNSNTQISLSNAIGKEYKVQIFRTTTKDLMNKILKEDLSLDESLKLYNYVKTAILRNEHTFEVGEDGDIIYSFNENLVKGITYIDDIFYEFIQIHYNIAEKELKDFLSDNLFTYGIYYLFEVGHAGYDDMTADNQYLIYKYPIISEISFCIEANYRNVINFNDYCESRLTRNK